MYYQECVATSILIALLIAYTFVVIQPKPCIVCSIKYISKISYKFDLIIYYQTELKLGVHVIHKYMQVRCYCFLNCLVKENILMELFLQLAETHSRMGR